MTDKDYFQHIANSLDNDDMRVLAILLQNDANAGFKAMRNADVLEESQLSKATFRRIIYKLNGSKFVEIIRKQKNYMLYITEFGTNAIKINMKEVGA